MELYRSLIEAFSKFEICVIGKLIKTIGKIYSEKKQTFLYQIILKGENGIQPIFQMVSEKHDVNLIIRTRS